METKNERAFIITVLFLLGMAIGMLIGPLAHGLLVKILHWMGLPPV